ncbi:MAG: CehA/McbA family metallohydrolase [Ignavibacteria bacterium]|nr:CehA/McbA family metallohydrolase [Ignavibacteria bacterium]
MIYEYAGALHIHSTYSDGTGSVEHIAGCANETGLDFIILTDHNTIQAKQEGKEKWYNNTMLIVGYEVNDAFNKNHYLVFGLDELIGTYRVLHNGELGCNLSAAEYVKLIKEKGGAGFIAHPFEKRNSFPEHPPYPWTDWDTDDFDGIEIWNHMSEWVEELNENNKVQRFIHPLKSIIAPNADAVKLWDKLNRERRAAAIGSVDAHAHKMNLMGFYNVEVFAYKVLFKSIRTHVLLESPIEKGNEEKFQEYKTEIVEALRAGRSFITNSYHGSAKGFRFFAEYDGEKYRMGDEIQLKNDGKKIVFSFFVPKSCHVKFIKNGKCIHEETGVGGTWDDFDEGCYRVECWIGDRAWIFSNHIRAAKDKK